MLLRRPIVLKGGERRAADVLVGALGGITGPLAALPGTWLTIWCGLRGWDKVTQRAVYQPYILVMQLLGLGALAVVKPQHGALVGAHLAYALPRLRQRKKRPEPLAQLAQSEKDCEKNRGQEGRHGTALPASRAHEIDRERHDGEHEDVRVHERPRLVAVLALVDVIPPEDERERDEGGG